jgi:23S rRNA pseudouridine2604 synthase
MLTGSANLRQVKRHLVPSNGTANKLIYRMSGDSSTRLNKFISESGLCSRREADRYIEQGLVFVDSRRAGIGDRVYPGNRVVVNGRALEPKQGKAVIFIALNKPVGITSTTETSVPDNIIDYVNYKERIFPIGRLDKDSQGLIFLTNDGDIVNKILRAGNKHEKEYVVTVNKPLTEQVIHSMAAGVPMLGGTTKKCMVKQEGVFVFRIILIQGLNRQIRRMCEHFGYEVTKLERVRIMNVNLKGLAPGDWRELTEEEIRTIYEMSEESSSNDDGASAKRNTNRKKPARHKTVTHTNSNPSHRNRFKKTGQGKRNDRRHGSRSKQRRGER